MFALIIVHQIIGEIVWCIDPIFIPLFKISDKQLGKFISNRKKRILNYEFFLVIFHSFLYLYVFMLYLCYMIYNSRHNCICLANCERR